MGSQILSLEKILDDCPTQTFQTVTTINAFRDTLTRNLKQEGRGGGGGGVKKKQRSTRNFSFKWNRGLLNFNSLAASSCDRVMLLNPLNG